MTRPSPRRPTHFAGQWPRSVLPPLVVLILVALLVAPLVVTQQKRGLRNLSSQRVEPAQELVNEIELSLSVGMSLLRGYELSDEEAFPITYDGVLARDRQVMDELRVYAASLGTEIEATYGEFREAVQVFRKEVTETEIAQQRLSLDDESDRLSRQQVHYEKALAAAAALRTSLLNQAERNSAAIEAADDTGLLVTVLLVLLAAATAFNSFCRPSLGATVSGCSLNNASRRTTPGRRKSHQSSPT